MELLGAYEARRLALSEPDTSAIVASLDASLEKAKLRHDSEFHLPLLEDAKSCARHLAGHHTGASAAGIIERGARGPDLPARRVPAHSELSIFRLLLRWI